MFLDFKAAWTKYALPRRNHERITRSAPTKIQRPHSLKKALMFLIGACHVIRAKRAPQFLLVIACLRPSLLGSAVYEWNAPSSFRGRSSQLDPLPTAQENPMREGPSVWEVSKHKMSCKLVTRDRASMGLALPMAEQ